MEDPFDDDWRELGFYCNGPWGIEVMTWPDAGMDDFAIHGPLSKLAE